VKGLIVPGTTFYLTRFYPRKYWANRMMIFFALCGLGGGFSGIIAYGCIKIAATSHYALREPWKWIFIIEGTITMAFSLFPIFL
jgi:MFS family permease